MPKSTKHSRRKFLKSGSLALFGSLLGAEIVFANNLGDIIPVALLPGDPFSTDGKSKQLTTLNDRPWNIETPAHLLDDKVTPNNLMFVRNNGLAPTNIDVNSWQLQIDGEACTTPKTYSIAELKSKFQNVSYQLTLECGGNGRAEFDPPAKGNQWTLGAVGCPLWTGVRLRDVLNDCGVSANAVYIGYEGKDIHLSGDAKKLTISRGVPIKKALENESLIAWAMNGEDLPVSNGYPLRLVFGGWPGSTSGKWLSRIRVRDKIHDGAKMGGKSYRIPCKPVAPGTDVADEDMCIIESMPVKSLITYPKSGAMLRGTKRMKVRGHAWAGDLRVNQMHVSIDFGATWQRCELTSPVNRHAWQHFNATVDFPKEGYYEVWARATDSAGNMQPMVVPGWNPKGYLNNATHRIAVKVL